MPRSVSATQSSYICDGTHGGVKYSFADTCFYVYAVAPYTQYMQSPYANVWMNVQTGVVKIIPSWPWISTRRGDSSTASRRR